VSLSANPRAFPPGCSPTMTSVAGDETDADLVTRARTGDATAWDRLVERLGNRVWAVARAHRLSQADAEDVFQVTWMQLMTHLDGIREPERVGAWLASTARHESLRLLRRDGRQVPTAEDEQFDVPDPLAPPPEAGLMVSERQVAVWEALGTLPPRCQRLLRLFMADPAPSYDEVSHALDMPIGSIGPTRGRCLEHLRRRLAGGATDPEAEA
jgi:RNA polymerase sigma factor (sigma-70 family)